MKVSRHTFWATNSSGDVSGILMRPPDATCLYVFAHGAGAAFFVVGGLDQVGGIALVDEFGAEAGAEEGNVVGVGLYGGEDFALVRFVFVVAALFYCYFAYGGV